MFFEVSGVSKVFRAEVLGLWFLHRGASGVSVFFEVSVISKVFGLERRRVSGTSIAGPWRSRCSLRCMESQRFLEWKSWSQVLASWGLGGLVSVLGF